MDDFFWTLLIVGVIEIVILYFIIKTAVKQAIRETREETKKLNDCDHDEMDER